MWPQASPDCFVDQNGSVNTTLPNFAGTKMVSLTDPLRTPALQINFCEYPGGDKLWTGSGDSTNANYGYPGIAAILATESTAAPIPAGYPANLASLIPAGTPISVFNTSATATPPAWVLQQWGAAAGNTPLASSLCEVVGMLAQNNQAFNGTTGGNNYVLFQTDGGENDSANSDVTWCFGGDPSSTPTSPVNVCATDWGFQASSTAGDDSSSNFASWEQRVVRSTGSWYRGTAAGQIPTAAALKTVVESPWTSSSCENGVDSYNLNWLVTLNYEFSTMTNAIVSPASVELGTQDRPMSMSSSFVVGNGLDGNEFDFYQALGTSTTKSTFRAFAYVPGVTTYGVPHSVPGDVDNSGCTDQGDLNEVLQKDVWLQPAPATPPEGQPVQLPTKADLNADGWVDQADLNMVLDNWGAGCAVPPQSPQGGYVAIPYVPTGLAATPSAGQIDLTWKASSMATGYNLLRSTASGSGFVTIASGLTATSYTDTTVTVGATYYYEVSATDSQGTSVASAQVSVTVAVPPPTPCANPITFTGGNSGNFNTTSAVCGRIAGRIDGWGCSNFNGRTLDVDDEVVTCGEMPLPAPWSDGYTYFSVSAGTYSYASIYWW